MPQNNSARCLHQILKSPLDNGDESKPIYYALASGLKIENPDLERLMQFGGVLDLAANTQGYLIPKLVEAVQQIQHFLPPGTN